MPERGQPSDQLVGVPLWTGDEDPHGFASVPSPHPPAGTPTVPRLVRRDRAGCVPISSSPARCLDELGSQSLGILTSTPLDPRAVVRRDQGRERGAVVMRGNRRQTPPPTRDTQRRSISTRRRVSTSSAAATSAPPGPHLQRERALARFGQHLLGLEAVTDLPASPSRSSPHAASTTASNPRSPRLRRRVSMLPRNGSMESVGSRASSCARRRAEAVPNAHPGPERGDAAQRVARILSPRVGTDSEAGGVGRRHVLGRVDGDVDASFEQRFLELLHEHATRADLAERLRAVAVAGGRDRYERDLDPGPAQRCRRTLGLGEREPTAAGTDAEQHRGARGLCATRHTPCAWTAGCERTQSESAAGAAARSRRAASRLLLLSQPEQVAHDVSIDHAVGGDGGLLHTARSAGGGACSRSGW